MESKSLAYWCESLCGFHSVWGYLTELGLWGKIVSYRTTQKETREIAYQCWSPNRYYFGCALQTFGGTEEKKSAINPSAGYSKMFVCSTALWSGLKGFRHQISDHWAGQMTQHHYLLWFYREFYILNPTDTYEVI